LSTNLKLILDFFLQDKDPPSLPTKGAAVLASFPPRAQCARPDLPRMCVRTRSATRRRCGVHAAWQKRREIAARFDTLSDGDMVRFRIVWASNEMSTAGRRAASRLRPHDAVVRMTDWHVIHNQWCNHCCCRLWRSWGPLK
jgi:hypothetical protein